MSRAPSEIALKLRVSNYRCPCYFGSIAPVAESVASASMGFSVAQDASRPPAGGLGTAQVGTPSFGSKKYCRPRYRPNINKNTNIDSIMDLHLRTLVIPRSLVNNRSNNAWRLHDLVDGPLNHLHVTLAVVTIGT